MNIAEEKVYIYGMMKDITDERRRLTEMYMSLKNRLDELNKLEERGVDVLATKGFFDMVNDKNHNTEVRNIQREVNAAIYRQNPIANALQQPQQPQQMQQLSAEYGPKQADKPDLPQPRYEKNIDQVEQRKRDKEEEVKRRALEESEKVIAQIAASRASVSEEKKPLISSRAIEEQKDRDSFSKTIRSRSRNKRDGRTNHKPQMKQTFANPIVKEILEDGVPRHAKEIYKMFMEKINNKYEISEINFINNVMIRASKAIPNIVNIGERRYQYQDEV